MEVAIKSSKKVFTLNSPAGFLEQHYVGPQDKMSVSKGVTAVRKYVNKLEKLDKPAYILVNLEKVTTTDMGSHMAAISGMKNVNFKKLAIYGPLPMQILINTLAIVADRHDKVRVFERRDEAIEWLRTG